MKWFEGGIPAAIQAAKVNGSVFIVYIEGEGESSSQMESYLHNEDVTKLCEDSKCVAVKLQSNSNDCKFFAQIYPVVLIPSTFFIANSGIPLEVIGEVKSLEDFLAKVKAAIEKQEQMTKEQPASASPPTHTQRSDDTMQASSSSPSSAEPPGASAAMDVGGVPGATAAEDTSPPGEKKQKVDEDLDTRVERAKELVDMKRDEKSRKEQEDAKSREMERRNVGQGVQKLRQQQKEQDILEARKEYKKNKEEDRVARQRVKDDIARDRAEKAARFDKEKEDRTQAQEEVRKRKMLEEQAAQAAEQARRSDIARIQFRKPDGSFVTHQFDATDTFATVYQFIRDHMGCHVTLSMTFPRRTLTQADHNSTLQELGLAPSAAILVLPASTNTQGQRGSDGSFSMSNMFSLLLAPFMYVWTTLSTLLGLSGAAALPAPKRQTPTTTASASGGDRTPGSATRRATPSSSRQDGAIHRFHNAQDDEDPDDKNTWNGNSTQQM